MGCETSKSKTIPAVNNTIDNNPTSTNSINDSQKNINNNWFHSPKLPGFFSNSHIEKQKEITNQKLFKALEKKRLENRNSSISFQRILLKFEKMHSVFKDVKEVFLEVSSDGQGLNIDGLQEAMKHLRVSMTKDEVADLFGFIDLDGSLKIELKEFLVALTIGMVLDAIPAFVNLDIPNSALASPTSLAHHQSSALSSPVTISSTNAVKSTHNFKSPQNIGSPHANTFSNATSTKSVTLDKKNLEIKEMLNLIVSAYLLFDPEGEGHIKKHNVEKLLEESGHQAGKNAMLSQDKWKEMDWDANGTIDFAEFVMAFSTWVDLDDEMA
eukprot:gene20471-26561_t